LIDPITGNIGSVAEAALTEAAKCQIARSLGLPIGAGHAGSNRGHRFNQDSICIAVSTMMLTTHTRSTLCDFLGLMESGLTYSLYSLVSCHEVVGIGRGR
jgi:trimethylamine:corrinoid methyltransferase-like protein